MAAHEAPSSLGFSRQEHWSGLPFPSPMRESEVAQSGPTLSDPMDCSLPGSSTNSLKHKFQSIMFLATFFFFPSHAFEFSNIFQLYNEIFAEALGYYDLWS